MQAMGWKEGQGIGAKVSLQQSREQQRRHGSAAGTFGKSARMAVNEDDEDDISDPLLKSKVAPEDTTLTDFASRAKLDRHGLGFDALKNAPDMACLPPPFLPFSFCLQPHELYYCIDLRSEVTSHPKERQSECVLLLFSEHSPFLTTSSSPQNHPKLDRTSLGVMTTAISLKQTLLRTTTSRSLQNVVPPWKS